MIQALVSRMAGYSATFKGLCITVTTAVCGFAITVHEQLIILLAIFPVIAFAVLDAEYLRVERRFRLLYDMVRSEPWDTLPSFEINLAATPPITRIDVLGSWSITCFYFPIAIVILAILIGSYIYGCL